MAIKAIETTYKGYRFRSRLEARWAVFFDTARVPFEYEKEGFDLGPAGLYLPDFWLPTVSQRGSATPGVWVEIKGQEPTEAESAKCAALCAATQQPVNLFVGPPGDHSTIRGYEWNWHPGTQWDPACVGWDNWMIFCRCYSPTCGHVKIEFCEGNYMVCPRCGSSADDDNLGLVKAYDAARAARFEHGERP